MKINYHLLTIFECNQTRITNQQKQPPYNNRPEWLLLKASSYVSIGCIAKYPASNYTIEIKEDEMPFYAKHFPTSKIHKLTVSKWRLIKIRICEK